MSLPSLSTDDRSEPSSATSDATTSASGEVRSSVAKQYQVSVASPVLVTEALALVWVMPDTDTVKFTGPLRVVKSADAGVP